MNGKADSAWKLIAIASMSLILALVTYIWYDQREELNLIKTTLIGNENNRQQIIRDHVDLTYQVKELNRQMVILTVKLGDLEYKVLNPKQNYMYPGEIHD